MVSSGESTGVVDTGAGSIVWVRRRNGSWWPGRILGPHDLSASHVMSPRSGTPVKLLGREDASVDWYNLEKSKRVKAFRCGEFDDCIERAEASQGLPAKKREKYARREDAILHALQLEKQFLHNKFPTLVNPTPTPTPTPRNTAPVQPSVDVNAKLDQSNFIDKNTLPTLAPKPTVEMASQLKGLQDVILTAVPLNRMISSTASEDSNPAAIATATAIEPQPCFQNSSDSDSRNSTGKGKRLLEGYAQESIPKRHRPLHPFINTSRNSAHMYARAFSLGCSEFMPPESSHMFTTNQGQINLPFFPSVLATPHAQHATFADVTLSGSSEETQSDSSETHSIEPRVEAGMLLSDAETSVQAQPRLALQAGPESISSDDSDEVSLDDRSQFHYLEQNASGAEVSKWQLKGKRNVRNMGKRPMDRFTQRTYLDARGRPLNLRETSHSQSYCHGNGFSNDAGVSEDDFDLHTHGFGQRGYLPSEAAARGHSYTGQNMIDWELAWGRSFRGYWEERSDCFSPTLIGRNGHDILIDVDLEVQASRQGEHVPWVSLMSKLDGKAIIGHPIQIESLEDGSTDTLLLTSDEFRYESDRGKVPPMWRTARRTANVRVPRPHQSSQLDVDEEHLHQTGKVRSKKSTASSSIRKGSLSKITNSHVSRSPQVKAPRKGNFVSNQKTKPLSSIGFDQVINKTRDHDSGHYMDGVIKSADSEPTTVACIPVKLAFSRLLEAVGRPPSGPAKQGIPVNRDKVRNSSEVQGNLCKF